MNQSLTVPSTSALAPCVLGQIAPRIPTAGRIRAGIKVLTKAAAAIAQAQAIYDQGVADGRSFDFIEEALAKALPDLRDPMRPKNVPWFTVRGDDFPHPDLARQILDAYGEDRGDGQRRLYRFPVIFPSDSWQAVMPHELVAWGANERKFWSEYSSDGSARYCKCHAPVPKDQSDKTGVRVIRVFGGRKAVLREDNAGVCDPEACPQYQARQCNLTGRFVFFMPGIRSLSAFELPTNSFYAMNAALQKFRTIAFMRGGRISGFLDGSKTPFYISKRLMEVPHIDTEGRAVRVKQWIIELEAPVDVTALLRADEDETTASVTRAAQARHVLEGSTVIDMDDAPSGMQPAQQQREGHPRSSAQPLTQVHASGGDEAAAQRPSDERPTPHQGTPREEREERAPRPARSTGQQRAKAADHEGPSIDDVLQAAQSCGVSHADYEAYASKRWGSGWRLNVAGRRRALEEVSALSSEPGALPEKVRAELDVFS